MRPGILILAAMLLLTGCERRREVQFQPKISYGCGQRDDFIIAEVFENTRTYVAGMSRQQIRELFGEKQLVSSFSRLANGWEFPEQDKWKERTILEFEAQRPDLKIATCDTYFATGGTHILFFDRDGFLVGVIRYANIGKLCMG